MCCGLQPEPVCFWGRLGSGRAAAQTPATIQGGRPCRLRLYFTVLLAFLSDDTLGFCSPHPSALFPCGPPQRLLSFLSGPALFRYAPPPHSGSPFSCQLFLAPLTLCATAGSFAGLSLLQHDLALFLLFSPLPSSSRYSSPLISPA